MGKHTPGPWKVVFPKQQGPDGTWHKQASPWVETSKGTPPIRQNVDHPGKYDEERHANARLIAAAPDLLEALKGVMAVFVPPRDSLAGGPPVRMFDAANAAIARAEGGGE